MRMDADSFVSRLLQFKRQPKPIPPRANSHHEQTNRYINTFRFIYISIDAVNRLLTHHTKNPDRS